MLRVRVLGELELEVDGQALPAPAGRPARALLAWLALNPGLHPRSKVAGRFWPDVREDSARASLRAALSALRPALADGAGQLTATRERLGFARDADLWVDARAFEELCEQGRPDEALALSRGELLAGLDDDWVHEARERHRALLGAALARAAAAAEQEGDLLRAIALTREQAAADRLSEATHRELIRRLAAAGDRGAALLAYNRLGQRLREELRVAPSAETRALVERVRAGGAPAAGGPGEQAAGEEVSPPVARALVGRRPASAFVGRESEAARLRAAWERAQGSEPALVLVAGEPGIGKSRLLAELGRSAGDERAAVLFGRCTEETLIPYQPFVEALDAYAAAGDATRLAAEAGPTAGELARLLPRIAHALPEAAVVDDPEGARYRLFEAIAAVLRSAAERWPTLVVLDDLHWADRPTLLLLAHLARMPGPARLLLAGAYRETELARTHPLAQALGDLRRERLVQRVALRGLERGAIAALLRERLGVVAGEDDEGLVLAVERETDGNPFFVEEVASHLAETGGRARSGVPEGIREVVGRRLDRLAPATDEVLRVAAVVGRSFDLDVLEALGIAGEDVLLDALDEAVTAGLVRDAPEEAGRYEFAHALIRDTLYAELTVARRARLHARVADALEALPRGRTGDHVAELAHHLFQAAPAGAGRRAVEAARAAAGRATSQLAWEEAAAQLERALEALELEQASDPALRGELLEALGEARMRAGERSAGRNAFRAAAGLAADRGDHDALARAALGYGGIGVQIFAPERETLELLEAALAVRPEGEDPLRARLLGRLAVERYYDSDAGARRALSAQAVTAARRAADPAALLAALNARHVALWDPDHLDDRLSIAREIVAVAQATCAREEELQGRNWLVNDLAELGDIPAFDAEVAAHAELAEELRLPAYRWYGPMWRAMRAFAAGRIPAGRGFVAEGLAIGRVAQDANAEMAAKGAEFFEHLVRGRLEALDPAFGVERAAEGPAALAWRSALAWWAAEVGHEEEAREHLAVFAAHGIDRLPLDANLIACLAELAEACAQVGEAGLGAQVHARLEPFAQRNTVSMRALGSWGHASHYLARLAALLGRPEEALARYRDALEGNAKLDAGAWRARSALHHAELLVDLGDPRARERAGEALAAAEALGLDGLIASWSPRLAAVVA